MSRKITYIIACQVFGLICSSIGFAENSFKYTQPEFKEFVIEYSYPYTVSSYLDSQSIPLLKDRSQANNNTPEDALISFVSAMANKDYEWFLSTWTEKDRTRIIAEDKENGWDEEFFFKIWDKTLSGKSLKLLNRIERKPYIYIGYQLYGDKQGDDNQVRTLAFVHENNVWRVTNEAACDPILAGWKNPDQKIKRPGKVGQLNNQCNP